MIKSLDELTDFLKICRKQGVNEIKFEGVAVSFGDLPKKNKESDNNADDAVIPTDELSQEQLMFFSSGGAPSENIQG